MSVQAGFALRGRNPAPELKPQVESVRRELATLEHR